MRVYVYPCEVDSMVDIPPSKSITHRAIICAALGSGTSRIDNICYSKDIIATINALRGLGAEITQMESWLLIRGVGGHFDSAECIVDCNESGSTLRFLIPVFSLTNMPVTFVGSERLMDRPQSEYEKIFAKQGIDFIKTVDGIKINSSLKSGLYELDGNVSSQFITGLLLALPLLDGDSEIKIKPPFESRSYIDLTLQVMSDFGVKAWFDEEYTIRIKGNQCYRPHDFSVEGDCSQLAFFAVLSAIKGKLSCYKINSDSKQGDRQIVDIIKSFHGDVRKLDNGYAFCADELDCCDIDLTDCPDLGPVLTVLCAFAKGRSTIYNASRLRIKESDRIAAMESELKKLLVDISSTDDSIIIGDRNPMQKPVTVFAHNDHRIAMSLAVFGVCGEHPVIIEGAECVDKSYPDFFDDLRKIGVRVEVM